MFKNTRYLLPASILILAILACNVQATGTPAPTVDAVGTAAVQTVAAQIGTSVPATAPAPASSATPTTPAAPPTNTPVPSATAICDRAKFVSETVPDGTAFAPNAAFTKSWRLRNTGACTWNSSYAIVFENGTAMNAASSTALSGTAAPGQEMDIPVNMQAPGAPGTYQGNWKLRNGSGVLFGVEPSNGPFWVKIVVLAPTPTATATSSGPLLIPLIPLIPLLLAPSSQQVYAQVTAPAGGTGHAVVNCPSGSIVTGGGYASNQYQVVYSQFATGNGWEVDSSNPSGSDQLLNAYAICLSNTSGSTQQVYVQVTAPAHGTGHAVVNCPSGSIVTGGGYASDPGQVVYSQFATGNSWEADSYNPSGSGQLLNAYAICLSGTSGTSQQVVVQVTAPAHGTGHAVVNCPSGSIVTGGGYASDQHQVVYSQSATGNGWEVDSYNPSGSDQLLNAYAICTTFP